MIRSNLETVVDVAALRALGTSPSGSINRYFLSLASRIDSTAKRKLSNDMVHVRTGNLRSSQIFRVEVDGGLLRAVNENTASYAIYVHNGTRPHEIRARRARFLTGWTYNGAPVFTSVVHHPGTKPRPWMIESQKEVLQTL